MKKIAKIVPFRKLPRGLDFFDYLVPEELEKELKIGSLVTVPMKKGSLNGLFLGYTPKSEFKTLKEVSTILDYSVPEKQVQFAQWFSEYYHISLASTLMSMVAQPLKKKTTLRKSRELKLGLEQIKVSSNIKKLSANILESKEKNYLLLANDQKLKMELLIDLIKNTKNQSLIILPNISGIDNLISKLPKKYEEQIVVFTKDLTLSKSYYFQKWTDITTGKAKIVIGTRNAINAPFKKLDFIFIDHAHSDDHKSWDQNPRFHSVECAYKIQELHECKLVLSSWSPRLEDYYKAQKDRHQLITLGAPNITIPVTMIDLAKEKQDKFTFLSKQLLTSIETALEKKEKYIIVVNKKGYAGQLKCFDCNHVPKCDKCNLPFVYVENKLKCVYCNTESDETLKCHKCNSTNIRPLGIGQDQIIEKLKEYFPKSKITDKQINADIYVTTTAIPASIWKQCNHLGIVYVDSLMYLPDFSAYYNYYTSVRTMMMIAQNLKYKDIHFQTGFIENPVTQQTTCKYQDFYKTELESRKMFNYPPFCKMLKLFTASKDKSLAKHEANLLYKNLLKFCEENKVQISEPYMYYRSHVRGRYRFQILLKFSQNSQTLENELISQVPKTWTIDKDPLNVI